MNKESIKQYIEAIPRMNSAELEIIASDRPLSRELWIKIRRRRLELRQQERERRVQTLYESHSSMR